MMAKLRFIVRDFSKMFIQNCILPFAYFLAQKKYNSTKMLYVFADAHHTELPFSLEAMYNHVVAMGIDPVCHFHDYTHEGALKSLIHAISFLKLYAQAKYVFICDTFLPVSSGNKADGTKVVQLCHFSGPFKKIGYATSDDVPEYYMGNVFKNYDLVSVSSPMYVPLIAEAMRQEPGVVQALGVSRSDVYYDEDWVARCRQELYSQFPDAQGKKILLWAPTFRGKAAAPDVLDNESFANLQEKLGDGWLVLIKHHPHDDAVAAQPRFRSNCRIPTERLLPVVDLLITDYSTVLLDYLIFEHPFILYAPDVEEYGSTRGFFIDYYSITKNLTTDATELDTMIAQVYQQWLKGDREDILRCKERFVSACDGKATQRILEHLQNLDN